MPHRILRWLPAVVAPVLVAGVAVAVPMSAGAAAGLPQRSAEQVLALIAHSDRIQGFSGTVQQTSALGLPTPPTAAGVDSSTSSAASAINLLTGTHTARIYASGSTARRVQVLDSMGERDVVQNGTSVWTWDSAKNTALHTTLPNRSAAKRPQASTESPADAAKQLLAAVRPSTTITVADTATVAGRAAYVLTLTPKTEGTTVGHVTIAVDGATGLPVRTQVFAKGATTPAISAEFTALTIGKPAASLFTFTPGKGVKVTEKSVPTNRMHPGAREDRISAAKRPVVTGSGWDAVVSETVGTLPASVTGNSVFQQVTKPVTGGRLFTTPLVNVLLTDDGHVYAGAVPAARLQALAAQR